MVYLAQSSYFSTGFLQNLAKGCFGVNSLALANEIELPALRQGLDALRFAKDEPVEIERFLRTTAYAGSWALVAVQDAGKNILRAIERVSEPDSKTALKLSVRNAALRALASLYGFQENIPIDHTLRGVAKPNGFDVMDIINSSQLGAMPFEDIALAFTQATFEEWNTLFPSSTNAIHHSFTVHMLIRNFPDAAATLVTLQQEAENSGYDAIAKICAQTGKVITGQVDDDALKNIAASFHTSSLPYHAAYFYLLAADHAPNGHQLPHLSAAANEINAALSNTSSTRYAYLYPAIQRIVIEKSARNGRRNLLGQTQFALATQIPFQHRGFDEAFLLLDASANMGNDSHGKIALEAAMEIFQERTVLF